MKIKKLTAYEIIKNESKNYRFKMTMRDALYFLSGWYGDKKVNLQNIMDDIIKLEKEDIIKFIY